MDVLKEFIASPAFPIGAGLLVYFSFGAVSINSNLKSLKRLYNIIFFFISTLVSYITARLSLNFFYSLFFSKRFTSTQLITISVILLCFSQLSPIAWRIQGRNNLKENNYHHIMNFIGALAAFVAILLLNRLPISSINIANYNKLFSIETIIILSCLYMQFYYESKTALEIAGENPQVKIASIFNALWLAFALSIFCLSLLHTISSLNVKTMDMMIFGFDLRWSLIIVSIIFLIGFLLTETKKHALMQTFLFFVGILLVGIIALIAVFIQPHSGVWIGKSWIAFIILSLILFSFHRVWNHFLKRNVEQWNEWTWITLGTLVYTIWASFEVVNFYK